jgi:hypothetical protein
VVWLAIATGATADAENLKTFAQKESISYPILLDPDGSTGTRTARRRRRTCTSSTRKASSPTCAASTIRNRRAQRTAEGRHVNYVEKALGELASGSAVSQRRPSRTGAA